jgi:hypothetical protein
MKLAVRLFLSCLLTLLVSQVAKSQCNRASNDCAQIVPRLVRFGGTFKNISGISPGSTVAVRFLIYAESTGGTPLWQEVQNVQLDREGHYDLLLGATEAEGMPQDLFASGQPRWLGVQPLVPGAEEQPRILMVSVPYALQAENTEKLGGLPASAYAKVSPNAVGSGTNSPVTSTSPLDLLPVAGNGNAVAPTTSAGQTSALPVTSAGGTVNAIPKFSGASSLTNSQILDQNGMVTMQNLANILFADQFSGGVSAAVNACPASGCIIYAVSPNVNLNLGSVDPGSKVITIYLGPFTFTVNQITLRSGLKIVGMGGSETILQSVNGNNPVFVLPQANSTPAANVSLSGFHVIGSAGNTSEDGFFLDTSSTVNSGLWYSVFSDIILTQFSGVAIHVKGRVADFAALSEWVLFNNVVVWRNPGGGNALRLEGAVFEFRFRNCEFDGAVTGDGTNIYLGNYSGSGGGYPVSIAFEGLVSQRAAVAVQINGGMNLVFNGSHHEQLYAAYQVTFNGQPTFGLTISDSYFAGNVGVNAGAGYLLSVTTTDALGIVFSHNHILGAPDSILASTNLASVVYDDNFASSPNTNVPPTSGITTQMSPAATINVQGVHTIGLNPSTTPITTIQSGLGPGEMLTFFTPAGPVIFGSGGNIDLLGLSSLTVDGTITFVRTDLGGLLWKPVSQWSPNTPRTIIPPKRPAPHALQ